LSDAPKEPVPVLSSLRRLLGHSAVYGSADVFTNVVNFLLVPVYTTYLSTTDYGTLAILFLFSSVAKIVFRMGLDQGFLRVYYDLETEEARRRFTFTMAAFALVSGAVLFALMLLFVPALTRLLLGEEGLGARRLVLLAASDVYVGTFFFVPLNLLRIQNRPGLFSTVSAGRQGLNTLLKVVLVVRGFGVAGVLASDVVATGALGIALLPITWRNASPGFSREALKAALSFGLPKIPHGFMIQIQNFADRKILDLFASRAEVGVYSVGYTFGMGVKFALSAFEPAWQPFVFSQIRKPNAPALISRVVTYAWAAFVSAGLVAAVFGRELLVLMTRRAEFWGGVSVIPVVTLAYVLHGAFLLTSLGIAIEKKARYYPVVTFASASTNLLMDFALIPRFGMQGAAWATVLSYAVMAGCGYLFSRKLYPIPFEWGRMGAIAAASLVTFAACGVVPLANVPAELPLASRLVRLLPSFAEKTLLLAIFPAVVFALVLRPSEKALVRERVLGWLHARGDTRP
jgi:O-antigen/teichoic acid export membrane protein